MQISSRILVCGGALRSDILARHRGPLSGISFHQSLAGRIALAGILLLLCFAPDLAAQQQVLRITRGNDVFAEEGRADAGKIPITIEYDLSPSLAQTDIDYTIAIGNVGSIFRYDPTLERVRLNSDDIKIFGICGQQVETGFLPQGSVGVTYRVNSTCGSQTLRVIYDGLDYTADLANGLVHVTIFSSRAGAGDVYALTGTTFSLDAYRFSEQTPLRILPFSPTKNKGGDAFSLQDNDLFTVEGDVLLDDTIPLSHASPDARAAIEDVVLSFQLEGSLRFLRADAAGNRKRVMVVSNSPGASPVELLLNDPDNPTAASVSLARKVAIGETFRVYVEGTSMTPYTNGVLRLRVIPKLEKPGVRLSDQEFSVSSLRLGVTLLRVNFASARIVEGNAVFASEAGDALQKAATDEEISLDVTLPNIVALEDQGSYHFILSNSEDFAKPDTTGTAVRFNGNQFTIDGQCGQQNPDSLLAVIRTALFGTLQDPPPLASYAINTVCPAQRLRLSYKGLDYSDERAGGALYLTILKEQTPLEIIPLQGADFTGDAYKMSDIIPLRAIARAGFVDVSNAPLILPDNELFFVNGNFTIDPTMRLSLTDVDLRPDAADVELLFEVSGDLGFLAEDAQGNSKRLVVTSNAGSGDPVELMPVTAGRLDRVSARIAKNAALSEFFVISIAGDSTTPFEAGRLQLRVAPSLEKAGLSLQDAQISDQQATIAEVVFEDGPAPVSIERVSGRYAAEIKSLARKVPLVFDYRLPPALPTEGQKVFVFSLSNTPSQRNNDQQAPAVRMNGEALSITGQCGMQTGTSQLDNGAVTGIYLIENCPEQTLRITYDGLDYKEDATGGVFYLNVINPFILEESLRRQLIGQSFFDVAYKFSPVTPFSLTPKETIKNTDETVARLIDNELFIMEGDVIVNDMLRLSFDDPDILASFEDVMFSFSLSGRLGFLVGDAAGNAKQIFIKSSIPGTQPVLMMPNDPFNPSLLSANLRKSQAEGEVFTVYVEGESTVFYEPGDLDLVVTPRLVHDSSTPNDPSDDLFLSGEGFGPAASMAARTTILPSVSEANVISGNSLFAREIRDDLRFGAVQKPVGLTYFVRSDLLLLQDRMLRFTLSNTETPAGHDQNARALRTNGTNFVLQGFCGTQGQTGEAANGAVYAEFQVFAGCPSQILSLTYTGFDYSADETGGVFYLTVEENTQSKFFALNGANYNTDAFRIDATIPFLLEAAAEERETDATLSNPTALVDNALFTAKGNVVVNRLARLSLQDVTQRAHPRDVKLLFEVTGNLGFLQADADGKRKNLIVRSSTDPSEQAVFKLDDPLNPTKASAKLAKTVEEGESYSIFVQGESDTQYARGKLFLSMTPVLEHDDATPDDATDTIILTDPFFGAASASQSEILITLPGFDVRFAGAGTFAQETQVGAAAVTTILSVVLPAYDGATSAQEISLILSNNADYEQHDQAAQAVRMNGENATITGDCGSRKEVTTTDEGAIEIVYQITQDCKSQVLTLTYTGLDYRADATGGTFYVTAKVNDVTIPGVFDFQGPRFVIDAYSDAARPFALQRKALRQQIEAGDTAFTDSEFFELVGDVVVQADAALYGVQDATATLDDVVLLFTLTGATGFLAPDAQGEAKEVKILSSVSGETPVSFAPSPDDADKWTARLMKKAQADETFSIFIDGRSETLIEAGILALQVEADLERNGITFINRPFGAPLERRMRIDVRNLRSENSDARFIMPWLLSDTAGQASPAQINSSLIISNYTAHAVGPMLVRVNDRDNPGFLLGDFVEILTTIPAYSSVEIDESMLETVLGDYGTATLELTIRNTQPNQIGLRRFTDVGGDVYVDSFGSADAYSEWPAMD